MTSGLAFPPMISRYTKGDSDLCLETDSSDKYLEDLRDRQVYEIPSPPLPALAVRFIYDTPRIEQRANFADRDINTRG
jgi:hypothetical protein